MTTPSNRRSLDPGKLPLDKSFVFYTVACVLALAGGITLRVVGRLFVSDLLIFGLFFTTIISEILGRRLRSYPVELLLLWAFPVVAVVLDVMDTTPQDDLLRGLARNAVFVAATWVGYNMAVKQSLYKAILFYFLLFGSVLIVTIQTQSTEAFNDLQGLFKYGGGMAVLYLILLLGFFWTMDGSAIFLLCGAVFLWWVDFRGYSFMFALSGLIIMFRRIIRSIPVWPLIGIGFVSAAVLSYVFVEVSYSVAPDQTTFTRREQSGSEREDMLKDAWQGFVAEPYTGNGSWQHARNFISTFQTEDRDQIVGVHNVWLQLAYEYGLFGVLVGGYIFVRGIQALIILLSRNWANAELGTRGAYPSALVIVMTLCYNWVAAPFAGIYRVYYGIGFGFCLYIVVMARKKRGKEGAAPPVKARMAVSSPAHG